MPGTVFDSLRADPAVRRVVLFRPADVAEEAGAADAFTVSCDAIWRKAVARCDALHGGPLDAVEIRARHATLVLAASDDRIAGALIGLDAVASVVRYELEEALRAPGPAPAVDD
jgi:hypothetical protein